MGEKWACKNCGYDRCKWDCGVLPGSAVVYVICSKCEAPDALCTDQYDAIEDGDKQEL